MTINDEQSTGKLPSKISRRTLAAGAAWSVPVIAVASAAPASALSGQIIVPSYTGTACKHPGQGQCGTKYYHFTFCFKNTSLSPITITLVEMTINSVTKPVSSPTSVTVGAGQTECRYVDAGGFDNSANGTGKLKFTYPSPSNPAITITDYVCTPVASDNDLPVCGNPSQAPNEPGGCPPHSPNGPTSPGTLVPGSC